MDSSITDTKWVHDRVRFPRMTYAYANVDNILENGVLVQHIKSVLNANKKRVEEVESEYQGSQELVAAKKREREMPSGSTTAKSSWPELVGFSGEAALEKIEEDNDDIVAVVLRPGIMLSENHRPFRVRIFVDENGLVTQVPMAG